MLVIIANGKRSSSGLTLSTLPQTLLHTIESIFQEIGLGIIATDQNGALIFANPAASAILGIEGNLVSLDNWVEHYGIFSSDGITICSQKDSPLARALAGEEANDQQFLIQNKLGAGRSLWCSINLKPLRADSGEVSGALLLFQDISDRKKLAEEVARSNMALQQFATVAAHDLQEPLRSIAGFADMLAEYQSEQLDEKSKRCMGKIKGGVTRMQTLINDLLDYSRIQTKPQILRLTDCNAIMNSCIKSLDASITEHKATINIESLPTIMADASQISQLLQNLVGNALKFTAADRLPVITISAQRQAAYWKFTVKDNGIGIAPEFATRVFRIFQRLHTATAYPGTGIGLAICQTIVERHGGRIWLESEPGVGSTFHFTIAELRKNKP